MTVLVKAASAAPLSVADARKQIEHPAADTTHDAHLRRLILEATEKCEQVSGLAFHLQTRRLTVRSFPSWEQLLPRPPLIAISGITYVDSDGDTQTLGSSLYRVATDHRPGFVEPAYGGTWPSIRDVSEAVKFTFFCGYGNSFTATTGDVITPTDQKYQNGDRVTFSNYSGALPAGLSAGTDYYVISRTATTFEVSTSVGGSKVDITDTGSGTHLIDDAPLQVRQAIALTLTSWFEQRSAIVVGTITNTVPRSAAWLLGGLNKKLYASSYGYSATR